MSRCRTRSMLRLNEQHMPAVIDGVSPRYDLESFPVILTGMMRQYATLCQSIIKRLVDDLSIFVQKRLLVFPQAGTGKFI